MSSDQRPDTDDYDLLTFGEVAARLSEELAGATAELAELRSEARPDEEKIRRLEERITLLRTSGDRYRQEERTNESFTRRFGSVSAELPDQRPQWR
jgi:chromosome segregation ATPase